MKKMMITLGITMLAGLTSFGQAKKTGSMYTSLGPVAGFGHSWVSGKSNQVFKPTANLGVGFVYSKYEHWGWGANLVASHEGYATEYNWLGNTYRNVVDPVYIRLTPRAFYFFGDYTSTVRPKLFLAPSVGVKVQEDHYMTNETMNQSDVTYNTNGTSMYKTMDLGAEGGAGVNVKLGRATWLNLDATYYQGVLNATKTNNMNQNVRINAGVMMGL